MSATNGAPFRHYLGGSQYPSEIDGGRPPRRARGDRFHAPVRIEGDVLDYLDSLVVMEPSHQPYNVRGARAVAEAFPGLPQVACFDSSFHRTMPEVAAKLSYDYISRQLPKFAPEARRVIVAHLGGGASLCAMLDGKSVETTMGRGALTGLPMATRSGDVPAAALFYLLRSKLFDDASLEKMLYERAGLLGLSEISGDMRVFRRQQRTPAVAAVEHFLYAMTKIPGSMGMLGGSDASSVFIAGIGSTRPGPRRGYAASSRWLRGVKLDEQANVPTGPAFLLRTAAYQSGSSRPTRNS